MKMPPCPLPEIVIDPAHFESIYAGYRLLHEDPEQSRPMIVIQAPPGDMPTWEERLADPLVMLAAELKMLRTHLEIGDDRVPTVRVQFGTGQVAAAFGCPLQLPQNNLPAAGGHVLECAEQARDLGIPATDAGWYGKLAEWTALWKEHLPEGVHIQHPDIQSAFNSAHLIRGNDIFTDFFDAPEDVAILLDKVTEFMLSITRHTKAMISEDPDWFFDWGAMWRGTARISNCSMQMISPELYREFVMPRDQRFLESIHGGRIHYCGISGAVIEEYFRLPALTGLDFDVSKHDFFALCQRAPQHLTLMPTGGFQSDSTEVTRMLAGDWPAKRNIVIYVGVNSIDEGKRLLERLRSACPYG